MKFSELYERIIGLWPEEIDISDGKPTGRNGYLFKNLSSINSDIESALSNDDHWGSIGAWSFFQAIHKEAKALHKSGANVIRVNEVSKDLIDHYIRSNIEFDPDDDQWINERNEYQGE
jgi:hypothetical protein